MTTATVTIDPARLVRSLRLVARRVGDRSGKRRYVVTGTDRVHLVTLGDDTQPRCDCLDQVYRGTVYCKHVLLVLIRMGDKAVLGAVADLAEAGLEAVKAA